MIKRGSFVLLSLWVLLTVNASGRSKEQERMEKIDKWYSDRLHIYHMKLDPCEELSQLPDDARTSDDDNELKRCTPLLSELHMLEATYNSWKAARGAVEKCDMSLDGADNVSVGACRLAAASLTRLTQLLFDAIPNSEKS